MQAGLGPQAVDWASLLVDKSSEKERNTRVTGYKQSSSKTHLQMVNRVDVLDSNHQDVRHFCSGLLIRLCLYEHLSRAGADDVSAADDRR